ncbi:hypothetical protein PS874_04631 [Pseudomonas fluorescens]|nr:hypothetical protein PS874_04631 [Pseudomonas fluorescens]
MLAKNQRPPLGIWFYALSFTTFASNRASTGCSYRGSMRSAVITTQAISRNSRRKILPTGVIGNDSRNTMCLGTLYAVKFSLQ